MKDDLPILNLSDPRHRQVLKDYIDTLKGVYRIDLVRVRNQRTLSQNAYFHGVIVPLVARAWSAIEGYEVGPWEAKARLKDMFLRVPVVNRSTGEVTGWYTRGTSDLDVPEMSAFIERCIAFARDDLGVEVPPAEEYEQRTSAG